MASPEETESPSTSAKRYAPSTSSVNGNSGVATAISGPMNVSVSAAFEKLDGASNYMDWRFAMKSHLIICDLWDYVDGFREDERQAERALGAIVSGVKAHLFSSIRECTSGTKVWETLEKLYQPGGLKVSWLNLSASPQKCTGTYSYYFSNAPYRHANTIAGVGLGSYDGSDSILI